MTTFYTHEEISRLCELLTDTVNYKKTGIVTSDSQYRRYEDAKALWFELGSEEQSSDCILGFELNEDRPYEYERFLSLISSNPNFEYILYMNPHYNNYNCSQVSNYEVYLNLNKHQGDTLTLDEIVKKRQIKSKYTDRQIEFNNKNNKKG